MAAKTKEVGHVKGKRDLSPSTPPNINVSQGITNPKQKPIPNYLKPTISSSNEICKHGGRHASKQSISKHTPKSKSIVELPSPPSIRKQILSGSPKGKPLRPISNSNKASVSAKPISNTTPKSPKDGHIHPLERTKNVRKEARAKETKEATATRTNTTIHCISEKLECTPHEQKKEEQEDESLIERVQKEVVEQSPPDVPLTEDENLCQTLDSEQEEVRNEVIKACDSTALREEQEKTHGKREISDQKGTDDGGKNHHSEEQEPHDEDKEEHSVVNSIPSEEGEDDPDEKLKTKGRKWASMDSGTMNKPHKLQFRRGKVVDKDETGGAESAKLKFRKSGLTERVAEDLKQRSMNIVLNRQGIREKKEVAVFNDVIEKTANQLVEERRSKVKALVGAFETIISLQ